MAKAKKVARPLVKKTAVKKTEIAILVLPPLKKGELYAGPLIENGKLKHHVILLPGHKATGIKWDNAMAWAKAEGGELPTRKEAALLSANCAEAFEQRYYWTKEVQPGYADYAFIQYFAGGYQSYVHKDGVYRARAVRRVPL